jgi:TRAP-type C4-dicarboxylate transport system permease large subunit
VLAFTGIVQELGNAIASMKQNQWLLFFLLMLLPFVLCIFVDQIAIMMILIPIYDPLIKTIGFDPVWFWMQFLIIMVAGAITPPFGYIIFALKAAVPEISLTDLFPPAWLFTVVTLAGVVLFTVFPDLITILPRLMK